MARRDGPPGFDQGHRPAGWRWRPPEEYKARLPDDLGLVHFTVEVHPCS